LRVAGADTHGGQQRAESDAGKLGHDGLLRSGKTAGRCSFSGACRVKRKKATHHFCRRIKPAASILPSLSGSNAQATGFAENSTLIRAKWMS
jgi:hypothetical protein